MYFDVNDYQKLSLLILKTAKMKIKKNKYSKISKQNQRYFEDYFKEYTGLLETLS